MQTISDKAIKAIKTNNKLMGRLMGAFDRGQNTIENWMDSRDVRLTTPLAVKIISEESELNPDEILEEEAVKEAQS